MVSPSPSNKYHSPSTTKTPSSKKLQSTKLSAWKI
jgi:hypothetical protein